MKTKIPIIIISPRFLPFSGPEIHRTRAFAECLATDKEKFLIFTLKNIKSSDTDEGLWQNFGPKKNVIRYNGFSLPFVNDLGLASIFPLLYLFFKKRKRLRSYKVVYFVSTNFLVYLLVPLIWLFFPFKIFVDYQDPWVSNYYSENNIRPPGGRVKFFLMNNLGKVFEPIIIKVSTGLTCTSLKLMEFLGVKYKCNEKIIYSPFLFPKKDFEIPNILDFHPVISKECFNFIYLGVISVSMRQTLCLFLNLLKDYIQEFGPKINGKSIRVFFIGTQYYKTSKSILVELIQEYNLDEFIYEFPERVGLLSGINLVKQSDCCLLFGSGDTFYNPSKINFLLQARKPLLCFFYDLSNQSFLPDYINYGFFNLYNRFDTEKEKFNSLFGNGFHRKPETNLKIPDSSDMTYEIKEFFKKQIPQSI